MSIDYLMDYCQGFEDLPLRIQAHVTHFREADMDIAHNQQKLNELISSLRKPDTDSYVRLSKLRILKTHLSDLQTAQTTKETAIRQIEQYLSEQSQKLDQRYKEYRSGQYRIPAPPEKPSRTETKKRKPEKEVEFASGRQSATSDRKRRKTERNKPRRRDEDMVEDIPEFEEEFLEEEENFCVEGCAVKHGDMVACDNKACPGQWFHYACVGLKAAPTSKTWYCPTCRPKFQSRRR